MLIEDSTVTMDDNQAVRGRKAQWTTSIIKEVGTSTMDNGHATRGQYWYHG